MQKIKMIKLSSLDYFSTILKGSILIYWPPEISFDIKIFQKKLE